MSHSNRSRRSETTRSNSHAALPSRRSFRRILAAASNLVEIPTPVTQRGRIIHDGCCKCGACQKARLQLAADQAAFDAVRSVAAELSPETKPTINAVGTDLGDALEAGIHPISALSPEGEARLAEIAKE